MSSFSPPKQLSINITNDCLTEYISCNVFSEYILQCLKGANFLCIRVQEGVNLAKKCQQILTASVRKKTTCRLAQGTWST